MCSHIHQSPCQEKHNPPKGIYDGAHHYTEWKEPGDHLIQLLWLMGKLRPIEKDWLMVTQDIKTDF